jgi:murein L,D-transpeptidase YafK
MRLYLIMFVFLQGVSFKESQLQFQRVKTSYEEKQETVKRYFESKKLGYQGYHLFLRGFKKERQLEIWIKETGSDTFTLLHTYSFCTTSGTLGPKRKEGDLQIPEGIYHINHFNPQSNFYLSLGINYPNASDKILSDKQRPGGSIYIHGNCVTIGCIPITDDKIKELYIMAVEARNSGQQKIPVHIFPTRLTDEALTHIVREYPSSGHERFWRNLKLIFDDFEETKKLSAIKVNSKGEYIF